MVGMDSKTLPGGLVIVFEGIDGTGKTTQLEMAKDKLIAGGWALHTSRNLGGTPIGEKLRDVILSSFPRPEKTNLYISVAIQEALIESIKAEREQGKLILMDRGMLSLAAYEIYGGGLDPDLVWRHVDDGMARLKPDLAIIYDIDVSTALERLRLKSGGSDYFESKSAGYFERVSGGYAEAAKRFPDVCVMMDANRSVDEVHQDTMQAINRVLDSHRAH